MKSMLKRVSVALIAMVATFALSLISFAAEAPRVENGVMYLDASQNHDIIVYGLALEVEGVDIADVSPLNQGKMMDVQVNGEMFKGISEIVIVKGDNVNKIVLDEGSYIVTAPLSLADTVNGIKTALNGIPAELNAFQQTATGLDSKALTYRIGSKGRVETVEGNHPWMLEKSGVKIYSYETKSEEIAVEERAKEQAKFVTKKADDKKEEGSSSSCSGSGGGYRINYLYAGDAGSKICDIEVVITDRVTVRGRNTATHPYAICYINGYFDIYEDSLTANPPSYGYGDAVEGAFSSSAALPSSEDITILFANL